MSDGTTVEVSLDTAEVALRELNILIDSTEDEEPDPLQDDVFRARSELREVFDETRPDGYDVDLSVGDVFQTQDGPIQIKSIDGDELLVTDPTVTHPQDARAKSWRTDADLLRADITTGYVKKASLDVVTE